MARAGHTAVAGVDYIPLDGLFCEGCGAPCVRDGAVFALVHDAAPRAFCSTVHARASGWPWMPGLVAPSAEAPPAAPRSVPAPPRAARAPRLAAPAQPDLFAAVAP